MPKCLQEPNDQAILVHAVHADDFEAWLKTQEGQVHAWAQNASFTAAPNEVLLLPGENGELSGVVYGLDDAPGPWRWSALYRALPKSGIFQIVSNLTATDVANATDANDAALGFALGSYRYDQYRTLNTDKFDGPTLVWPEACDRDAVRRAYGATKMVRDLVNAPASDLGPAQLARAAQDLAEASDAQYSEIVGVDLIREGFPAIYAVGRGSEESRAPRLIDFTWGPQNAPKVTLVGKGVCFDTGGLDIKSAAGMKIMKKDMGGAAHVLGLASMIMSAKLNVRLRVLIPAVENSVSAAAMRPLDVISTRKGLSLEIGHTDAEGRVVLADALALASEESPDLILDFATLTGAARVALGPDLPALFCNDEALSAEILKASEQTSDPMWRMPLYGPYKSQIKGKVADLRNDTDSSYAGAIMAGLFLESFVEDGLSWAHVDLMAWNVSSRPGRPEGGEALTLRAMFKVLENRYAS